MKKLFFICVFFTAVAVSAQQSKKDKILNLFELNGKQTNFNMLYDSYAVNKTQKAAKVKEVLAKIANVYETVFSEQEINEMLAFYKSDAGKALINDRGNMTKAQKDAYGSFQSGAAMQKMLNNKTELATKERTIRKDWLATFSK